MNHGRRSFILLGSVVLLTLFHASRSGFAQSPPATSPDSSETNILQRLAESEAAIQSLRAEVKQLKAEPPAADQSALRLPGADNVLVHGSGAVAFFDNEWDGGTPENGFRVDEAFLFLDAQLAESIFFFLEVKITERDTGEEYFYTGELYVDFEDVDGGRLGSEGLLNLRCGRFDIPFGEEYLSRDAIKNPMISHSLADTWGVDEGVELYGRYGRGDYALAVQNGGHPSLADGDDDKAVVGRLGFEPVARLRLSVSAMRTGKLDPVDDEFSELWFGNTLIPAFGAPGATNSFEVNVYEVDARWRWDGGHVAGHLGMLDHEDNDDVADNGKEATYYMLEVVQDLVGKSYGGVRFSQVLSDDGYPVVGNTSWDRLFAGPNLDQIWRLSMALGYRWNEHLVVKGEYTFERGETVDGDSLDEEDLAALQLAFGF